MLNFYGKSARYCDGVSRRSLLQVGTLAFGGAALGLPQILNAQASTGSNFDRKAIINIFLGGGPPHQDMWDVKTDAPAEIRGEFSPIATNVPGIEICEVFPRLAGMMDKLAIIRSVVGNHGDHDCYQCYSGWPRQSLLGIGGRPSFGPVLGKLRGPRNPAVPVSVGLAQKSGHVPWSDTGGAGFLGAAYQPFKPEGEGMADLKLNRISVDRLGDRRTLLQSLDRLKRDADQSGIIRGMDAFNQAAFGVLTSSAMMDALDLSKEDPSIRARYGDGKPFNYQYDGCATANEHLLLARRLVEVGVRSVTLTYGRWDAHGDGFRLVRDHGSKLDQGLAALISDLDERGMLNDVSVVVWGEFGRTPRVNAQAGRDHWPQVNAALLAGGGMRTGQVIGSTNRLGEFAKDRPVHMQEITATLYRNLGIDTANTTLTDPTGRPQFLVENAVPIPELVG